jgi:hypothetical protein
LIRLNLLDLDPVRIRYLERLHDHEQAHPGEAMESGPFLIEQSSMSLAAALDLTRTLDGMGLVNECNGLGSPAAWLTDGGREAVRKIRAHRSDPANRAAAARTAALAHTYEATLSGNEHPGATSAAACARGHGEFLAAPLNRDEMLAAVNYLEQKGLLTVGTRNAGGEAQWVSITASGEDCMEQHEGDVGEYLRRQRAAATTYNNHVGPVFHGSVDGAQLAWNNQTVTQIRNETQQVAPGFEAIAEAVADTLRQLLAIGLPEEDQQDAEAVANEVLAEVVRDEPNRGRIRRAVATLRGYLAPVAAGAALGAGEGAQELARNAIEHLGSSF